MNRSAVRKPAVAAAIGMVMVMGIFSAIVGRYNLLAATAVVLVGILVFLLWDIRRRAADLGHMARLAARRQAVLQKALREEIRKLRAESKKTRATDDARLPEMERRLLAGIESERLAAADRHRESMATIERVGDAVEMHHERFAKVDESIRSAASRTVDALGALSWTQLADIEAMFQLLPKVDARAPLPASGNWAMNARSLLHLADLIQRVNPRTVLELGGGTSTVWLGYLLQDTGARVVSVDHDEYYAGVTSEAVQRHGLRGVVEVRTAPLTAVTEGEDSFRWYDPAGFADVEEIDVLIVDGPPKRTGPMARYPALPQTLPRLSADAVVVLDDADRPDEVQTIERWISEVNGLIQVEIGISRLAVLRRPTA